MARSGQRPQARRGGVALGVLGIMLLAFFAIVFMLGRPGYWKSFNDLVHHPFDPHPIGIDKRHKETIITGQGQQPITTVVNVDPVLTTKTVSEPKSIVAVQPTKTTDATATTTTTGASSATEQATKAVPEAQPTVDKGATQTGGAATVSVVENKPASTTQQTTVGPAATTPTTTVTPTPTTTVTSTPTTTVTSTPTTTVTTTPTTTVTPTPTTTVTTTPTTTVTATPTTTVTTTPTTTVTTTPTTTVTATPTTTTVTPATTTVTPATTVAATTTTTITTTTAATTTPATTTTTTSTNAATATGTASSSSGKESVEEEEDGKLTTLDNEYKPTREMVQRIAQNGYLMVTWANYHYFDFVRTWVDHVRGVGVTGYMVGAMDDHLLREMINLKYNCFSMKSGLTLGDFGWGSATFAKMGREKIRLIAIFLKLDVNVVIADVDVLWLRNPVPYFDRFPEADILTSSDSTYATVKDDGLEKWPDAGAAANIGIMMFRKKSLAFVEDWIQVIEADDKIWDQNAFNDLFRRGWRLLDTPNKNLFLGYDGSLTIGILPVSLFCSGHTMFVQRLGYTLGMQPYAVHATFQFSGTPGKRHRMREFKLYSDPPEYYDHATGFISFDMDGLPELLKTAGPATNDMTMQNVQGHFKLVTHQLLRLRTAFAISTVLHRALVMPPLWCGLDRWWAPHPGRIPGSDFVLPFQCPLDHVIDLENGVFKNLPEDHFGPPTEIREYSFFNNSAMTPRVRDDKLIVEICAPNTPDCSDGKEPAKLLIDGGAPKVRIQAGLPSALLENALFSVKTTKVLHFTTMKDAMGDFSDAQAAVRFTNRMKLYGSIWCCILAHPGHIHYDLLLDQPHTDKFGREWNSTWVPVTGP